MEEPKSKTSQLKRTLSSLPPPPADPHAKSHSPSNKRKLIHNPHLHNSPYYKLRAIARQLRPHFLQVLQAPDFRNCKAAHEIQEQTKLMVDLYRQIVAETDQLKTFVSKPRPLAGENMIGKSLSGEHQQGKQSELLQPKQYTKEPAKNKSQKPPLTSEQKLDDISQFRGSYIVGGSVFGWNFITFSGSKPVYYGVTRESFQSSRKKSVQNSAHNK